MNALYREALKNIFEQITVHVGVLVGTLMFMLIPGMPWWVIALGIIVAVGLIMVILGRLIVEAQQIVEERGDGLKKFVPLESLDNVARVDVDEDDVDVNEDEDEAPRGRALRRRR